MSLLYNRYRVPVSGLEEVPDRVIGNLRGEGPPLSPPRMNGPRLPAPFAGTNLQVEAAKLLS